MKRKHIRLLSLVLAFLLLFAALPLTAYAAESELADTGRLFEGETGDCR